MLIHQLLTHLQHTPSRSLTASLAYKHISVQSLPLLPLSIGFDPGPIIGGSVAGVVLLTIVVGVLSWCVATRKGRSGRRTQQKTTPTTHPYYRMPAGKFYIFAKFAGKFLNNTQAHYYTSPQHEEQPESNTSYNVTYSNNSDYEEVEDFREGVGYTAASNLTNGHCNTTGSHDMYSDIYI